MRAETAQLTDGLERSLLILEGATKEQEQKVVFFWLCFVFFLFTGDYWIGGLPGPHPHNHLSTTIGWIEVSTARATHRLTVSITTPFA